MCFQRGRELGCSGTSPRCGLFVSGNKRNTSVDIDHVHVSPTHAHSSVLKATAQQHKIRLADKLAPYSGCLNAKGIHAAIPHHMTARAPEPVELISIDSAGFYLELLGGSRYVIVFVDTASRLQGPYGTQDKSAPAILAVVKRFVADAAVPRAFRTDNGSGRTRSLPSTVMILGSAAN